ncbi:glycosyltransferase family 2 protein [Ruminococcus sp. OM08-7]|nr:glycosyltransferase family 2 protein [Ruminococcus sp. TM10-9AT]RHU86430.1 glycosyltransferase family 2 protein [Ruminococcus sp. OM08-7]
MSVKTLIKGIPGAASPLLMRRSVMTASEAEKLLNAYSPRPTGSCIAQNAMKSEVDLQIIVPAHNVESFIADCLESVVQQKTKYRFLATVVNDGATDRTGEIVEKYRAKYPKLIETITQENKGFSDARNTALSCLKGSYITFLDSDDLLKEGAVEHLMSCAEAEDADIVQGNWTEFAIGGGARSRLPFASRSASLGARHFVHRCLRTSASRKGTGLRIHRFPIFCMG